MFRILIVEDIPATSEVLRMSLADVFPGSRIDCAFNVGGGSHYLERAASNEDFYNIAILDFKLPRDVGENPEVDTSLCDLIRRTSRATVVMHISAFSQETQIKDHLSEFHSSPAQPDALMYKKNETDWVDQLIVDAKKILYGQTIKSQLDSVFGAESLFESDSFSKKRHAGDRSRTNTTHELAELCRNIVAHWDDIDEMLQTRIRNTFRVVETDKRPIRISLI